MKNVKIKKSNKNNSLVTEAASQEDFDMFMQWVANQVQEELDTNLDEMLNDLEKALVEEAIASKMHNNNK